MRRSESDKTNAKVCLPSSLTQRFIIRGNYEKKKIGEKIITK